MKKTLLRLLLFVLCSVGIIADAQVPRSIVGGQAECDTTFSGCIPVPLSASLLCDGGGAILDCPQFFAPDWQDTTGLRFFGITNRTNPPRCVQSTNGGGTWGLCPSNPFVAALDTFGASMTVASDGSLIVAGNQGANDCIIRRSTDYGTSWTTVFTDTTVDDRCGINFATPTSSIVRCAATNAYCVVVGARITDFNLIPYFSTNNGATWTKGTLFSITASDQQIGFDIANDASLGILSRFSVTYASAVQVFAEKSGNEFILTGSVPTPSGAGTSTRCSAGQMIFGSSKSVVCGPDSLATTTYRLFNDIGGVVTLIASFALSNAPAFANAPDFMAIGFNTTVAYVIGRNVAGDRLLIHVTQDTFNSAILMATIQPTTALISGCCTGDVYLWNGKIYFTSGGTGSVAFFGRIQ